MDPYLEEGSTNSTAVAELQRLLKNLGYFKNPTITGSFGSITTQAVKDFQRANGLTADGKVGAITWAALKRAQTTPVSTSTSSSIPLLMYGSKGAAVAEAQKLLQGKGYYRGRTDGEFGSGTRDAVIAFQRAKGLYADGKVGEDTWKKLRATDTAVTPAPAPVPAPAPAPTVINVNVTTPDQPSSDATSGGSWGTPVNPVDSGGWSGSPISPVSPIGGGWTGGSVDTGATGWGAPSVGYGVQRISLVDATRQYNPNKPEPFQDLAIQYLQDQMGLALFNEFVVRWGSPLNSMRDAFISFNRGKGITSQGTALQWLEAQLSNEIMTEFTRRWYNNASFGTRQINLFEAACSYHGESNNQRAAIAYLQGQVDPNLGQEFLRRWTPPGSPLQVRSLEQVFMATDRSNINHKNAWDWLQSRLSQTVMDEFSRKWFGDDAIVNAGWGAAPGTTGWGSVGGVATSPTSSWGAPVIAPPVPVGVVGWGGGVNVLGNITLVAAAESYNPNKPLPYQDLAIDYLQGQMGANVFSEFAVRWGSPINTMREAFATFNRAKRITSQGMALQWLESKLSNQVKTEFTRRWFNNASASPRIALFDAASSYQGDSNSQRAAVSYLQSQVDPTTGAEFVRRWTPPGSPVQVQNLEQVFLNTDSSNINHKNALDWLQTRLNQSVLDEFSRQWFNLN